MLVVDSVVWTSVYDLYATTEGGRPADSVTLKYRARVMQSTGEDWTDATIILSTATSDTFTKGIPSLPSSRVTLFTPPAPVIISGPAYPPQTIIVPSGRSRRSPTAPSVEYAYTERSDEDLLAADLYGGAMTEPGTLVSESALALSYAVEGKSSIPSDGVAHLVSIASLTFDVKTSYVAVPSVEPVVHLSVSSV
jgi:hypothetical protein